MKPPGLAAVCLSRQRVNTSALYTVRLPIYCITNAWTLPPYMKAALFVHTCDFQKEKKETVRIFGVKSSTVLCICSAGLRSVLELLSAASAVTVVPYLEKKSHL